jgi:cytochrome c553
LLFLVAGATLAVTLPLASGAYKPPVQETSGVPDGSSASQPGHAAAGKKLFVTFCGKCHVMQVVNTKGTIGPNLDRDQVSYTGVINAVVKGVGGIQAEYLLRALTFSQIYDVAKFVTTQRR